MSEPTAPEAVTTGTTTGTAPGRPRVLSGIQPTADSFHLGNYLGAVRNWVGLQDSHEAFYMVVDMHAITVDYDPEVLRQRIRRSAAQLFAVGLEPSRSTVFVQSQVHEHAELAWILGALTGFGEASRMTQFKDKSAKHGTQAASVGLFTYPILQAADILLYTPPLGGKDFQVPVGEDQRQHLELTRTLAGRFNHRFGPTFVEPDAHILKSTAKIQDLQEPERKMSKSSSSPQGIIDILDEPGPLKKKIMRAVTDAETEIRYDPETKPGVSNLLTIMSALGGEPIEGLEGHFAGAGYGQLKKELAELALETFGPIRERTLELLADPAELDRMLAKGAERASEVAAGTMDTVRERVGYLRRGI
ncbi:tryptophan--tRNA ligase [Actinocorallia longicatena]|uniref:Tryptophan--tRNA ligase n=1 Tax=Actinocorallia longicatena TaxID=111803 RepID=A0ABP6QG01_9ACTN